MYLCPTSSLRIWKDFRLVTNDDHSCVGMLNIVCCRVASPTRKDPHACKHTHAHKQAPHQNVFLGQIVAADDSDGDFNKTCPAPPRPSPDFPCGNSPERSANFPRPLTTPRSTPATRSPENWASELFHFCLSGSLSPFSLMVIPVKCMQFHALAGLLAVVRQILNKRLHHAKAGTQSTFKGQGVSTSELKAQPCHCMNISVNEANNEAEYSKGIKYEDGETRE